MNALDKLDIWKDLKQVRKDGNKVNQATSISCSVGEEAGDISCAILLTDARDGEKVRDKCSAHSVLHIHWGWNKERPKKHMCTFNLSL